jgi:RNA-binding proteins (RRM domain)
MSRGSYSMGKRQRESMKARKKKEKAERRARRREEGPSEPEIVTAEDIVGDLPSIAQAMDAIENPDPAARSSAGVPCRLFVGGLSWDTNAEGLRQAFGAFGPVADAVVVTDRDTGRSRGFGFVTMADRRDATKAIAGLDGTDLDGRRIVVNIATER